MPCAACHREKRLKKICNQCAEPLWCSDVCCISQATVHVNCPLNEEGDEAGRVLESIGVRTPGGQLRSLRGRTDFRRTLDTLFTALLDVNPMYEAYTAEYNAVTVNTDRLALALSRYSDAVRRVKTRQQEFEKMLDGISSSVAGTLASAKSTLKAALNYDTETALRMAIGRTPPPDSPETAPDDMTFANSFGLISEFVSANAKSAGLAVDSVGRQLSHQFVKIMALAPSKRPPVIRKFKEWLKSWTRAMDDSFTALIKSA